MSEDTLLQDQPLGHKLIKKGFWLYFFMLLTAPVGYIVKVLISNTLSVEDVGLFYSVLGLLLLFASYHDLGLTEALQYYLPKYWIHKEYNNYKTILYITILAQIITGLIIAFGLYFGADWLAIHHFRYPAAAGVLKTLCRFFLGINFIQVAASVYTAFQDTLASSLVEFVRLYTVLGFTLIFWLSHTLTLNNYSFSWIIGVFIAMIFSLLWFKKKYGYTLTKGIFSPNILLLKKQIKYAVWIFLGANVATLLGQVDQQIIVHFLGTKDAGYYTNFFSLFSLYNLIISPLLGLLFPIVIELQTKNDIHKLEILQNIFYKYFSLFALSIGGLFVAFGPHIASILFGSKFLYSGFLLQFIGPFLVLNVLTSINFGILAGIGKAKERVKILLFALLVNLLINALGIFILKIGVLSAVWALVFSWMTLMWGSYIVIRKNCPISFNWKYFLGNLGLIGFLAFIAYYIIAPSFVLQDSFRYINLLRLLLYFFGYYVIIALVNWKSIRLLFLEYKQMKSNL